MKFSSEFQYVNELEQRVTGTVDAGEISLQLHEPGRDFKLYFQSKEEVCVLIELLCAMEKSMEK